MMQALTMYVLLMPTHLCMIIVCSLYSLIITYLMEIVYHVALCFYIIFALIHIYRYVINAHKY